MSDLLGDPFVNLNVLDHFLLCGLQGVPLSPSVCMFEIPIILSVGAAVSIRASYSISR